ncbi:hypothetical protein H4582DRAFT_1965387 [Lactarius indigo]|nr:hypothetical protein H4582DRAFT_2030971 [Lactarius indigo]KAI9436254.1 hypothetical protein H4582DRAFT_1965387 [Lactarius indigo]
MPLSCSPCATFVRVIVIIYLLSTQHSVIFIAITAPPFDLSEAAIYFCVRFTLFYFLVCPSLST